MNDGRFSSPQLVWGLEVFSARSVGWGYWLRLGVNIYVNMAGILTRKNFEVGEQQQTDSYTFKIRNSLFELPWNGKGLCWSKVGKCFEEGKRKKTKKGTNSRYSINGTSIVIKQKDHSVKWFLSVHMLQNLNHHASIQVNQPRASIVSVHALQMFESKQISPNVTVVETQFHSFGRPSSYLAALHVQMKKTIPVNGKLSLSAQSLYFPSHIAIANTH